MKPPIWFERPILAELADGVASQVTVIEPEAGSPFARLDEAVGALAGVATYDREVMDRAPRLLAIARTGIGVDTVDIDEATKRGIAVCNAPDGPTVSTAEHAVMLLLMASRRATVAIQRLQAAEPDLYGRNEAIELQDKTLGLVGWGRIARRVAAAARGLGMAVATYDPFVTAVDPEVRRVADLKTLLETSDAISLHVPLTDATRRMFDAEAFSTMRPGAIFVNTARGGLVDQEALLAAIESGHLFAAALDVTEPEPLPPGHPLFSDERIIITPHVASGTAEGKRNNFTMALDQLIEVAEGRRPSNLVNPEAWDLVARRWSSEWAS